MGTTFENIHIFTRKDNLPEEIKEKYKVKRLAEDWITLFPKKGHSFYNYEGDKIACHLSGVTNCPILWVSYFDDDIVILAVFWQEERVCGYSVSDCLAARCVSLKKPNMWKKVLKLTERETEALCQVSKSEEIPWKTLDLLSPILGLPLYTVDYEEVDPIELYQKQSDWVQNWLEQNEALERKNHTYMTLCCELPGVCAEEEEDSWHGIIRICPPNGKGSFEYRHICCYMIKDEIFVPVYDYWYPKELFGKESKRLWLDSENKYIHIMDINGVCNGEPRKYWNSYGNLLKELISDNGRLKFHPLIRKSELIETKTEEYQYFCKQEDSDNFPILIKERLDTLERITYEYESEQGQEWFWNRRCFFEVVEKQIVVAVRKIYYGGKNKVINDIRVFDEDLNILQKSEFCTYKEEEQIDDFFIYSPERQAIYYKRYSYDLVNNKISSSINIPQVEGRLLGFDQKGNLILIKGITMFTVFLLDPELQVLSRHQLQGMIYNIYRNQSGNYCFVTTDEFAAECSAPQAKACVRIYELSYK